LSSRWIRGLPRRHDHLRTQSLGDLRSVSQDGCQLPEAQGQSGGDHAYEEAP
jgi:hypothetical protein